MDCLINLFVFFFSFFALKRGKIYSGFKENKQKLESYKEKIIRQYNRNDFCVTSGNVEED